MTICVKCGEEPCGNYYRCQPIGNEITPINRSNILYRTGYFVLPRLAIESLPFDLQSLFISFVEQAAKLGLETPEYHVLRKDAEFTTTVREDETDDLSRIKAFWSIVDDPWSDYHHGDISKLCPNLKCRGSITVDGEEFNLWNGGYTGLSYPVDALDKFVDVIRHDKKIIREVFLHSVCNWSYSDFKNPKPEEILGWRFSDVQGSIDTVRKEKRQ